MTAFQLLGEKKRALVLRAARMLSEKDLPITSTAILGVICGDLRNVWYREIAQNNPTINVIRGCCIILVRRRRLAFDRKKKVYTCLAAPQDDGLIPRGETATPAAFSLTDSHSPAAIACYLTKAGLGRRVAKSLSGKADKKQAKDGEVCPEAIAEYLQRVGLAEDTAWYLKLINQAALCLKRQTPKDAVEAMIRDQAYGAEAEVTLIISAALHLARA